MRRRVPSGSVSNRGRRRLEVRVDGGVGVGLAMVVFFGRRRLEVRVDGGVEVGVVMVAVLWSGDEWDFVGNRFTWWFGVR